MIGKEEPSAVARNGARALRDMYVALVAEGFTESEAVRIIGQVLASQRPTP